MIHAGELTKRITIQVNNSTQNDFGEHVPSWIDLATVWAKIEITKSRNENVEKSKENITKQISTYNFTIRYRTDITRYMRIKYNDLYFEIKNIENVNQANEELILLGESIDG